MKRILSFSFLLVSLAVNSFAGPVHTIEVKALANTPLVASGDFVSAKVSGSGQKTVLSIKLTDAAAKRMKRYTAEHVGEELPLVVDGKLVSAPVIRVPIKGNAFQIQPINESLANELAQFINSKR